VRKIIDHYQIILIARKATNRGSPQITVDEQRHAAHAKRKKKEA
jgi:hypothetical protein